MSTTFSAASTSLCGMLIALACSAACGSEAEEAATPEAPPAENTQVTMSNEAASTAGASTDVCNEIFNASDVPFLTAAFPTSDACPTPRGAARLASSTIARLVHDEPGRFCMAGAVTTGWAMLIVSFDRINALFGGTPPPQFREPLDSVSRGITQLRFTVDTPPASGLLVSLSMVTGQDCTTSTASCIQDGFYVIPESTPGVPFAITEAGTQTWPIADFEPAPWLDPTLTYDPTRMSGVQFEINPGPFDFCIHDFQLLDSSGTAVLPE